MIYPATAKHIEKYTKQDMRLISESADDYRNITLPFLQTSQFSTKVIIRLIFQQSV